MLCPYNQMDIKNRTVNKVTFVVGNLFINYSTFYLTAKAL